MLRNRVKLYAAAVAAALLWVLAPVEAGAQALWVEGSHYFRVNSSRYTSLSANTVEVVEVFSYGCPACYAFNPTAQKIKARLPAALVYLPASFIEAENWPVVCLNA